jgi:hypothetical protein
MALKIQPTPTLTGEVAERILKAIERNNAAEVVVTSQESEKRKNFLNKILQKAKI